MRVVFLTHNYPRRPGDIAGAFLATLAHGLVARGLSVRVIAPSDGGDVGEPMDGPVAVQRVRYGPPVEETLAYRGTMTAAVRSPRGVRRLVALGRALRAAAADAMRSADVLHAHWWIPAGLAAPPNVPMVLTSHGTDAALLRRSGVARLLARPVYRRASVVTAVSSPLAGWITEATGREVTPDHVQPMPVDTARFRPGQGGGGAVVIARLGRQKRVELAIDAVAALRDAGTRLPLTVVGDGPERVHLEARAAERGLGGLVVFRGAVPPGEVPDLLATADLMLATAAGEGFGLAAAEALMAGVPVAACTDGGGLLDVVPPAGAGRIVPPDSASVAAAAAELMKPEARTAAREAGALWRERLGAAHVAAVCERWYEEALRA